VVDFSTLAGLCAALVAIPLVRWLHLRSPSIPTALVPALYVWSVVETDASVKVRGRKPDRRWRRRAAIAALLCLSAGGLYLPAWKSHPVTVWLDDSASMGTLDPDKTRLQQAVQKLRQSLASMQFNEISVRSLTQPGTALNAGRNWSLLGEINQWTRPGGFPLRLPFPAQMKPSSEHWLVSDGADPSLAPWLEKAPISEILQVGQETENVGLTRLAARYSVNSPRRIDLIAAAFNAGRKPQQRELIVRADTRILERFHLDVPANKLARAQLSADWSSAMPSIEAVLRPTDALAGDDRLTLGLQPLAPVPVRTDDGCPRALKEAVAAHPRLAEREPPALLIACGSQKPVSELPSIWFREAHNTKILNGNAVWHPNCRQLCNLHMAPPWLRVGTPPPADFEPLLSSGDQLLIGIRRERAGSQIGVFFAIDDPILVHQSEYPALMAGLVDLALERTLLGETAAITRPTATMRVAPLLLEPPRSSRLVTDASTDIDLTPYLIMMTFVLLLWDTRSRLAERR
jgi:hypothetical protein